MKAALLVVLVGAGAQVAAHATEADRAAQFCDAEGSRGELDIQGRVAELSVAPSGRVWLATQTGRTYYADDVTDDWLDGALNLSNDDYSSLANNNIDRITWFDDEIGFASGYISGPDDSRTDTVYRTEDAGATWQSVQFPSDEWIYDVFATPDGKAWMGGSSGSFLHSADFGATWTRLSNPFKKKDLRTHSIYMKNDRVGVVGALGNAIKLTMNNGASWKRVPTPLDQGLLERDEDSHRDGRIEEVAIFRDFLLVEQEGRAFFSRMKPVKWNAFEDPQLIDFAIDPKRADFVGVTADLDVVRIDSDLERTVISERPLHGYPIDVSYVNDRIVVIDGQHGLYELSDQGFQFSHPLTTMGPREPMYVVRHRDGILWATARNHIYKSNDNGESWCRLLPTHTTISGLSPRSDGSLLLWDGHGKNLLFDPDDGTLAPFEPFGSDDVIDIVNIRDIWVAYGGMQYETTRRIEVARTYFSGQFRGSVDHGFVYVSEDSGLTWVAADTWKDGGAARVFVTPQREIYVLSYLGSVRKLAKTDTEWRGEDLILANQDNADQVPYVEKAFAFFFGPEGTGFIGGWIHHIGNRYFATADGGYTWQSVSEADFPYRRLTPFKGGHVATTGRDLVLLSDGDRSESVELASVIRANEVISDISVDDEFQVLLQLTMTNDKGWSTGERRWVLVPADTHKPNKRNAAK